jgi:hypothetical protein
MSEGSTAGEFLKWLGQALVLGVGWVVVHRLSALRDRDKARREMVAASASDLMEVIDDIFHCARQYHLKPREISAELRIKMSIQDVAARIAGLSDVCNAEAVLAPCRTEIGGVRRAITGHHFEDEHEGALQPSDKQLEVIADAVLRAKRQLLRLKHLQFPVEK